MIFIYFYSLNFPAVRISYVSTYYQNFRLKLFCAAIESMSSLENRFGRSAKEKES